MIDLTFEGNGFPNGLGPEPLATVGTVDYSQHGWFYYYSFTGVNAIPAPVSVLDSLYNNHAQLIGTVYVPNDQQLNGTVGGFMFFPDAGLRTTLAQVYVNDATYPRTDPAVPEASTWIMVLVGFAALFLPGAWRKRAAVRT